MDEFGVLVESIGFRAHGKSAPMAALKHKPRSHFAAPSTVNTRAFDDSSSLPVDELDGIFRSSVNISKTHQPQNFFGGDDIFGGPVSNSHHNGGVDLESVFSSSNKHSGSLTSSNSSASNSNTNSYDDLLGSNGSKSEQGDAVVDLFGIFEGYGKQGKKQAALDDLIPGVGGIRSPKTNGYTNAGRNLSKSSSAVADDPFLVFESSAPQSDASWPFDVQSVKDTGKGSVQSSMDDLDDFFMGGVRNGSNVEQSRNTFNKLSPGTRSNRFKNTNYVDETFGGGNHEQRKNAARPSRVAENSLFDDFFHEEKRTEVKKSTSSQSTFNTRKASMSTTPGDDFSALFGDVIPSSGEFVEIEGEPAERRAARRKRYLMTNTRMAEALALKNQRDHQIQCEQEEKRELGEALDNEIRRWAAGKEGNLRALLSSLHQILGPESGWRPVALTDLITWDSVKKAYMRANLYVHPDKVQQRGANIRQQCVAEKVFDLLKDAWTKFSSEELR
ncbi:uncharacterized protein LOC127264401 isoform X2 [Andrographis paniculata]|uniref:uncharacterized protein LOC127264401 isoform X2 n=1 Tax=Andrographis paniculata TaxID=175694 RepID=UPI0021E93468|nr:uncharacterized protein LOC127264401 isoform X2 [Andrographis paniculata]